MAPMRNDVKEIEPTIGGHPRAAGRLLNIGLVSEEYPSETGWGGIGTYTYNLARGLAILGHRVHVITRGWGAEGVKEADGVRVHRVAVPSPSWRWGTWWINQRFRETREILLWNFRVREAIQRIISQDGLDVIETPEYHAQALVTNLGLRRIPMVVRLHMPAYLCRQVSSVTSGNSRLDTLISEKVEYWMVRRAEMVVSASRSLAEEVSKHWRIRPNGIRCIPLPIDEDVFCPEGSGSRDDRTILYVGRLSRLKGVETLAQAFPAILRLCPGARVRFVGNDHPSGPAGTSMLAHLRSLMERAGVPDADVEFTGPLQRGSLPEVYRQSAVCVVPSYFESCGYTCLEAMACGCPVVASAAGGLAELINDEADGLLVPAGSSESLTKAVVRLLTDPGLRRRLSERARVTVRERFARSVVCGQTAAAYESLLG